MERSELGFRINLYFATNFEDSKQDIKKLRLKKKLRISQKKCDFQKSAIFKKSDKKIRIKNSYWKN